MTDDNDLIRRGDVTAIPLLGMTVTQIERAIRAIPAAAPVVTVKPLESALFDPDSHWGDFIRSAVVEAEKAMRKFPQPNYVITKIAEEAGEVVKAAVHAAEGRETLDNVRGEMRQLLAMMFRLWVEGDQVHGLPPVSGVMAASALTIHPADPLSDPRVVALVEAARDAREAILVLLHARNSEAEGSDEDWVCDLNAALRAIGGEA